MTSFEQSLVGPNGVLKITVRGAGLVKTLGRNKWDILSPTARYETRRFSSAAGGILRHNQM